jgi:hypothetical protein
MIPQNAPIHKWMETSIQNRIAMMVYACFGRTGVPIEKGSMPALWFHFRNSAMAGFYSRGGSPSYVPLGLRNIFPGLPGSGVSQSGLLCGNSSLACQ